MLSEKKKRKEKTSESGALAMSDEIQSTNAVLMISPDSFQWSSETAVDNAFMDSAGEKIAKENVLKQVVAEHANWVQLLRAHGIIVHIFSHGRETPDAVFPNNWFVARGGFITTFPMKAVSRRRERREDILKYLFNLFPGPVCDLTKHEKEDAFFEGTGSAVIDWKHGVIFVSLSQRSHLVVAKEWAAVLSERLERPFRVVSFESVVDDVPVYHTNVIMAIGTHFVVICFDAVVAGRVEELRQEIALLRKQVVIEITKDQVKHFCGNVLELASKYVVMSDQAFAAFTEHQKKQFHEAHVEILHAPLHTLERVGGGGIRCCLAELFL